MLDSVGNRGKQRWRSCLVAPPSESHETDHFVDSPGGATLAAPNTCTSTIAIGIAVAVGVR